ncbi:MAG TPA: glycosyltransferase family 4 protein [Thermoplasmata archaeon]|nr:glycosyltransferase family 4 protein [Thermoplasmata archaeon]
MPGWSIDFLATAPPEETRSGLSRVVWDLGARLVQRGHRVRVLYPSEPFATAPPHAGVERVPLPVVGLKRETYARERAIARAASDLLSPMADLIVANDEKGGAIELPRGPRAGRPIFGMFAHDVQQHHLMTMRAATQPNPTFRQRIGTWLDRRAIQKLESTAFRRASAVVVGSEANKELLRKYYPVPAEKIHVIPPSIPPLADSGDRAASREALRIPLDVPVVSFIGRTPDRQGLPLALEAFRRVRVFFPGARFLVVGGPAPSEPGVAALGIVDEVTKAQVLRASDLFLFPARYEGFGLAPREAMRAGVATILSRHVPLDGNDGVEVARIVKEDDAGAYASELAELLADPALRRTLAERGRAYSERFGPEVMAEKFEAVFRPFLPDA